MGGWGVGGFLGVAGCNKGYPTKRIKICGLFDQCPKMNKLVASL